MLAVANFLSVFNHFTCKELSEYILILNEYVLI